MPKTRKDGTTKSVNKYSNFRENGRRPRSQWNRKNMTQRAYKRQTERMGMGNYNNSHFTRPMTKGISRSFNFHPFTRSTLNKHNTNSLTRSSSKGSNNSYLNTSNHEKNMRPENWNKLKLRSNPIRRESTTPKNLKLTPFSNQ